MASPHVAGVVANYLQTHDDANPAEVATAVLDAATVGKVKDPVGSPNKFLFSRIGATSSSPPPPTSANRVVQPGFESGQGIWTGTEWSIDCGLRRPRGAHGRLLRLAGWLRRRAHHEPRAIWDRDPGVTDAEASFYVRVDSSSLRAAASSTRCS